ncbi:hypothetical protein Avbf_11131 [Armadillidium vulgare]|nr:hypothetical protein Avbf_11131 [Armadillidium vulgare]
MGRAGKNLNILVPDETNVCGPRILKVKNLRVEKHWFSSVIWDPRKGMSNFRYQIMRKLEKSNARNPVMVRMDFELRDKESEGPETPVMSPYTSFPPSLVLSFVTGCENDICRSDLVSNVRIEDFDLNSKILIGQTSKIVLIVETVNEGDPAFLPNITINIPKPINCSPFDEGLLYRT